MSERRHLLAPFGLPPLHDPDNLTDKRASLRHGQHVDMVCTSAFTPLLETPSWGARTANMVLFGEPLQLLDRDGDWAQVIALIDRYVGWLPSESIAPHGALPSHRIAVPLSHRYSAPDLKSPPLGLYPMGGFIRVEGDAENGFLPMAEGGWFYAKHLAALGACADDPVTVAETFIGAPYLWGGRTAFGIDCSGFVQIALARTGYRVHRDSGPQFETLGRPLEAGESPMRGDLAFFPGHVGWMLDSVHLLHANATHMAVTVDPVDEVTSWVAKQTDKQPFLGYKRLS